MWKVHEVAARLRVCTKTVYRLIRRGDLAAVKDGRVLRIPEGAVLAYLDAKTTQTSAASNAA